MKGQKEFIVAFSGVNTSNAIFTVVALYVILRARSGAMQAVKSIMGDSIVPWEPIAQVPVLLALLLVSIVTAATVALFLTLYFGKAFAKLSNRIPYKKLIIGVISFVTLLIFLLSGPLGLGIAAASIAIGFIPPLVGIGRVHLMGSLMLPVIMFFLGLDRVVLGFLGLV